MERTTSNMFDQHSRHWWTRNVVLHIPRESAACILLSIARLDLSVDRRLTNGGQFFIESIWALNEFKNFIKTSFDFSSDRFPSDVEFFVALAKVNSGWPIVLALK